MKLENIKWHNSKNIDQILRSFAEGKPDYPVVCPDCGSRSGHVYINRYQNTHRGRAWAWCSTCRSFGHYSYAVPVWWGNYACVDREKLCAANPNELVQYETALDDHVNYQLMRYCMSDNVCQYCIRKEYETPKTGKCPQCGRETWTVQLDGVCMLISCSSCGFEVIGASFFPPCMNDDLDYTITVREVTKEKKIKLARLFGRNVAEIIKAFRENGQVQKTEKLEDAKMTIQSLIESEISFDISPDLMKKYPHLIGCQYRD